MHFEDDVDMKVNTEVDMKVDTEVDTEADVNEKADLPTIEHIQELQAIVAQYEQEKSRLKKKDKKIEQVKLHWQSHNQEAAQIITSTISEIESDINARLDWEKNDAVADYKLAVHWKLFVNSSLINEDDLESTEKRWFTDLDALEIIINKAIE